MRVLAIMGSPRKKGNTYQVVEKIRNQMLETDQSIEFEYLFLADCNIQMCTGCFACFAKGKDKCPLKDDRDMIEAKMLQADGIIFAAPTYAMGIPALAKNFIDRFAYASHRPFLFDKAFLLVSTVGGVMGLKVALGQLTMLACGNKATIKLGIPRPPLAFAGFEKRAEKKCIKASKAFFRAMSAGKRKAPGLADWAYFSSFKTMTANASYQKICPADYEYYKGKDYFYPVTGHPVRRLIGGLIKGMMKTGFKFITKE